MANSAAGECYFQALFAVKLKVVLAGPRLHIVNLRRSTLNIDRRDDDILQLIAIRGIKTGRDVTKFEFEFDDVRTPNVFNGFEIRRMLLASCCGMQIRGKMLVLLMNSYAQR